VEDHCINKAQLIAEAIVFSFLQKKRHPERSNFLTPCIGITKKKMIITMYDSEHDVLLQSSDIMLMSESCKNKFSVKAIFITWLVVNYKFLCTGLTVDMLPYKAQFFDNAKESLNVYQHELQIHNVGSCEKLQESIVEVEYNEFLAKRFEEVNKLAIRRKLAIKRSLNSRRENEEDQGSSKTDGGFQ
jgi:hypothetical protein